MGVEHVGKGRRAARAQRRLIRHPLLFGLVSGILLSAAAAALVVAWVARNGVVVTLDGRGLADEVRAGVQSEVARALPEVLERMKSEVPGRVSARVNEELGDTSFVLYGVRVNLPASATQGLRDHLRDEITKEFQEQIDEVDVAGLAKTFSSEAADGLTASLSARFERQPLVVQVLPGLAIPVLLRIQ